MGHVSVARKGFWWAGVALVFTAFAFASPAQADVASEQTGMQVELGVTGGIHIFADDLELGVADDPGLPTPKNAGLFGLRAALAFNWLLSLEIEGVGIPTGDRIHNFRLFVVGWRAHLLAHVPMQAFDG
jgi:hypothetical protein